MKTTKTTTLKKNDIKRDWYIVDCTDKVIGRVATKVAYILQGKNKSNYAPNLNNGDCVILINTSKLIWTGKKSSQKLYRKHTGYQGGLKEIPLKNMMVINSNVVIEHAISKMLPKTRMRNDYFANLYCYRDNNHKHEAQQPKLLEI